MAGTVVLTNHHKLGQVGAVVITATADAADGSFPATTLASLGLGAVSGTLLVIQTNPGAVAPTDNYDITLIDGDGLDRLNSVGLNRDTTSSERAAITGPSFVAAGEPLTLTIANNAVNSAVIVITLYYAAAAVSSQDDLALAQLQAINTDLDSVISLLGTSLASQVWKSANYTTQQTGATIWDPTSSTKIAITSIVIGSYGTTAGRLILWFGANADTTYSAGTDQLVLAASFAPSATAKPGLVFTPATPILCSTADHELHITTDAALSVDLAVYGYEWS